MSYTQDSRTASVKASSVSETLLLYRLTGSEKLSCLFEYELELLSDSNSIDLSTLLGNSITVSLQLNQGGPRSFNGLVTKVSQAGMLGHLYLYRATMQPKPWLLTRAGDCKVMPANTAVPDIVKSILGKHGYTDVTTQLSATYQPREYCVQYRETDFNFISRLMEEEGIYYFFRHTDSSHTMVLCDSMTAHDAMPGDSTIGYFTETSYANVPEHIDEWHLNQEIRPGSYTLNDFDFTAPTANLINNFPLAAAHPQAGMEIYDYPGSYTQATGGSSYAQIRMEEQRAEFERITAAGNVRGLATGSKFTLADFPRSDQNAEYLVVSTRLQIQNNGFSSFGIVDADSEEFRCGYEVISSNFTFRPSRVSPMPVIQGVQTAIVVGESGDEITTDEYGRVKVQFHWDRLGTNDENSSCWIRVAQIWAGKGWGGLFIPRIGQEVIVDFLEGNPDRPIIIGAVYNADQTSPITLPDNKTQSGIMSRSSTGGSSDNFNQIRFEDKKGSEEIFIQAEKDFNVVVENNQTLKVGSPQSDSGNGNQTVDIYNNRTVTLEQGDDQLTVSTGDKTVEVSKGNEALTVDQGNQTVTVSQGNRTINVNNGTIAETAGQSITLTVGQNSIAMDTSSITLTVGQSSIKMDATSITLSAMNISIEGKTQAELKGLATTVSADGDLTVKGAMVMIN